MIFFRKHNTNGKRDGDEFYRKARELERVWNCPSFEMPPAGTSFEKSLIFSRMLSKTVRASYPDTIERMAFFGHGTKTKLLDFGFNVHNVALFAAMINAMNPYMSLYFFCCSLGKSRGFLKALSGLCPDAKIVGHTTRGHTTRNPNIFLFSYGKTKRFRLPDFLETPEEWGSMEVYEKAAEVVK